MILLEKYYKDVKLEGWTCSFERIEDLIKFMKKKKLFILGKGYRLEIKEIAEVKTKKLFGEEKKKWHLR